ncbi:MAG: RluA family pseudouridine synthase [Clostridia bacterium]|nr:RluA family pseudouridine synthase [Deltaproteobacteria bacterium]
MVTFEVTADAAGVRLDKYLVALSAREDSPIAGLSRTRLQKLIDDGNVLLDGKPARAASKLVGVETITLTIPVVAPLDVVAEDLPLDILFEDADLIVIAKSADMVVHPGSGRNSGTVVNALLFHCKDLSGIGGVARPGIVHRLDRGTSGVLVVAKNDDAHEIIAKQFAERQVVKRYIAFVLGAPPSKAHIETMYGRHPIDRKRFSSKVDVGKNAITDYTTVRSGGGLAELDVLLGTGRTHQIRVHLSEAGFPVGGDALYEGRNTSRVKDLELRALVSALTHQALHARTLTLTHPSKKKMTFEAPLPPELVAIRQRLVLITTP